MNISDKSYFIREEESRNLKFIAYSVKEFDGEITNKMKLGFIFKINSNFI